MELFLQASQGQGHPPASLISMQDQAAGNRLTLKPTQLFKPPKTFTMPP
jgi:hypothetical protein